MDKIQRKSFNQEERQKILDKTCCSCGHCGKKLDVTEMTVDHIFPLYKGGTHDEYNLIALCKECNNEKSNFVYEIEDYYKHIKYNHYTGYKRCFSELKIKTRNNQSMINVDTKVYKYIPYQSQLLIANMCKRKGSKRKVLDVISKCSAVLRLEKAYEADAADIAKFMDRIRNKVNLASMSMYDNEYKILNAINYDEVYVLRSPDRICGAFLFTRISDDNKVDLVQIKNMEEVSCLKQKYIMTFGYVDAIYGSVYPDIMNDLTKAFIKVLAIPMYFNIINDAVPAEYRTDYLSIPWELDGIPGTIEVLQLSSIRERLMESMDTEIDSGLVTKEEVENWVETLLESSDLPEKKLMLHRNDVEVNMYSTIYNNMVKNVLGEDADE